MLTSYNWPTWYMALLHVNRMQCYLWEPKVTYIQLNMEHAMIQILHNDLYQTIIHAINNIFMSCMDYTNWCVHVSETDK